MRIHRNLLALALAAFAALPALAQDIGTIQFAAGTVEIVRGTQRIPAVRGTAVRQGDSVVTGANSAAQLTMVDNALISMRAGTTVSLERYQFDGTSAGAGEALIALVRGTMRTFTGLIVARDRDKFKMRTTIATLGIRGSGNILAHDDANGTVNHTLTGAHSVTGKDPSGVERTLVSYPGQTIQVLPGQAPRFIPTPPFILAASSQGGKAAESEEKKSGTAGSSPEDGTATSAAGGAGATTVATSQASTSTLGGILVAVQPPPDSGYESLLRTSNPIPAGFEGVLGQTFALNGGGAVLDPSGRLVLIRDGFIATFLSGPGASPPGYVPTEVQPANITFQGGTHTDGFRTADGAVTIGRWEGGAVVVNGSPFLNLGPRSVTYDVTIPTLPGVVGSFSGFTTYSLVAATRPTDSAGNVGTVGSATVGIDFTTRIAQGNFSLGIAGQNFTITGTSPLEATGNYAFASSLGNVNVACNGPGCASVGYQTTLNGRLAGADALWTTVTYRVNPRRLPNAGFTDLIVGSIVLGAGTPPTVGIQLPQTGTANLVFTGVSRASFSNFGAPINAQVAPTTATGTLNANFSNRTVGFSLTIGSNGTPAGPTYQATVANAPIVGAGFSASTTPGPNLGTATVTCVGSPCGTSGSAIGRFDGIFTASAGNQGTVTFGIGDSLGVYQGDARFGVSSGPVASPLIAADTRQAATAMTNEPARAASAALLSRDGPGAMGRRAR